MGKKGSESTTITLTAEQRDEAIRIAVQVSERRGDHARRGDQKRTRGRNNAANNLVPVTVLSQRDEKRLKLKRTKQRGYDRRRREYIDMLDSYRLNYRHLLYSKLMGLQEPIFFSRRTYNIKQRRHDIFATEDGSSLEAPDLGVHGSSDEDEDADENNNVNDTENENEVIAQTDNFNPAAFVEPPIHEFPSLYAEERQQDQQHFLRMQRVQEEQQQADFYAHQRNVLAQQHDVDQRQQRQQQQNVLFQAAFDGNTPLGDQMVVSTNSISGAGGHAYRDLNYQGNQNEEFIPTSLQTLQNFQQMSHLQQQPQISNVPNFGLERNSSHYNENFGSGHEFDDLYADNKAAQLKHEDDDEQNITGNVDHTTRPSILSTPSGESDMEDLGVDMGLGQWPVTIDTMVTAPLPPIETQYNSQHHDHNQTRHYSQQFEQSNQTGDFSWFDQIKDEVTDFERPMMRFDN